MKAGKGRLAEDTARAATTDVVKDLLRNATSQKEIGAEQVFELRLFKKSCSRMGVKTHAVPCIREARAGRNSFQRNVRRMTPTSSGAVRYCPGWVCQLAPAPVFSFLLEKNPWDELRSDALELQFFEVLIGALPNMRGRDVRRISPLGTSSGHGCAEASAQAVQPI